MAEDVKLSKMEVEWLRSRDRNSLAAQFMLEIDWKYGVHNRPPGYQQAQ